MRQKRYWLTLLLLSIALLLGQCTSDKKSGQSDDNTVVDYEDFDYPVDLRYAKGFSIQNEPGYKVVTIFHPDRPDTLDTYVIYPRGGIPPQLPHREVTAYLPVPMTRIVTTSSVQLGAFPLLECVDCVVGITSPEFVNNTEVRARYTAGEIKSVGRGMSKDMELMITLQPEAILMDFTRTPEEAEKFGDSGIPLLLFNSWKEQSLLGRAEWLKFIGLLVGENRKADTLFQQIVDDYIQVQSIIAELDEPPIQIMYGQDYKGTWYIPGEYSYVTQMFRDAGLVFKSIPHMVSSQPGSFEEIFRDCRHAKLWFCTMAGDIHTVEDFISKNERYTHFDAAHDGKIVCDRKRVNEFGGNDYWESGPYRPDLLLKDLIKVSRPYLLPDYETTYWLELPRQQK